MSSNYQSIDANGKPKIGFIQRLGIVWLVLSCIFFVVALALAIVLIVMMDKYGDQSIPEASILPRVRAVDDIVSASAEYNGHFNRDGATYRYYRRSNFYNKKPTKTIKLLPEFKTYQQTNGWGCGAAASLMALSYLGEQNINEHILATETGHAEPGAQPSDVIKVFKNRGYTVVSSLDDPKNNKRYFPETKDFVGNLTSWLDKKIPMLVKLGGHWSVIIGYDDVGMPGEYQNHVLILADSWDTHDFHQDGYIVYTFDYFWNLWTNCATETELKNAKTGEKYQQFVVGYKS
ncbi:putative peptidase C39 [Monocercomonoides exilis]|uniref:putative peptidase C39 n=1 Tax=Monocercomonoides exilis TaxID=2049356 RepID=UPI0035595056|nr:putative peptidase C39 [Monocercomonoides exilis]|eukprot:MONOS_3247.1-p1 / transcript=MONOS_3247.1 / gene=MONOS_3247 / organism=Monocercomonoides_exilis_PA203 / gene_product=uncharacterized protein / transcript_product=uncharacterized protein / location=Mono_scaffold00075:34798-35667(+) / protein_length=289 / sequence_SO=supercontig / SO=protein_coding / is_pseudo=false